MRCSAFDHILFLCLTSIACWGQTKSDPVEVNRSGVFLLKECQQVLRPPAELTDTDAGLLMHCTGYMLGIKDVLIIWGLVSDRNHVVASRPPACLPPRATAEELARVVVNYLNSNPDKLHDYAQVIVFHALENAYPCK